MSNLLEKASIIHVPAGYDEGSINAVKPKYEVIDTELLTNNTFDATGDWGLSGGKWDVVGDGYAVYDSDTTSGDANLTQSGAMVIGETYIVKVVIDSFDNGGSDGFLGLRNPTTTTVEQMPSAGTYYFYIKALSTTFAVRAVYGNSTTLKISISEVSVKKIDTADFVFDRGTSATQTRNASDGDIESVGVDIPRIDYQGGVGHWLIEPTATNLLNYSEDFSQYAGGTRVGGFPSPDGGNNAYKISHNGGVTLSFNPTNLLTHKRSIWAKTVSGTGQLHLCSFNGNTNNLFTITNEWQRFEVDGLTTSTGANGFYAADFRGSSTLTEVYVWGAQAELSDFVTSYIPTNGSTATRDTEVASGSGDSTMFNDSEGVLYLETASLISLNSDFRTISISDGTNDETLRIRYSTTANRIDILTRSGASTKIDMNYTVTDVTDFHKIALKYKSGDSALWVDGVERATSTTTFTHSGLRELKLAQGDANAPFYGKIKCIAVFKEALTDAELQCLTT